MGTGSFRVVQRPGRGIDYPPPCSAEVKEGTELYFCSPLWVLVACSTVNFNVLTRWRVIFTTLVLQDGRTYVRDLLFKAVFV